MFWSASGPKPAWAKPTTCRPRRRGHDQTLAIEHRLEKTNRSSTATDIGCISPRCAGWHAPDFGQLRRIGIAKRAEFDHRHADSHVGSQGTSRPAGHSRACHSKSTRIHSPSTRTSKRGCTMRWIELMLAGRDVELPAVPGAGHDAPVERALAQRSALVRANAVQRIERALDVEQAPRCGLRPHSSRPRRAGSLSIRATRIQLAIGVKFAAAGRSAAKRKSRRRAFRRFARGRRRLGRVIFPAAMQPPILLGRLANRMLQALGIPLGDGRHGPHVRPASCADRDIPSAAIT